MPASRHCGCTICSVERSLEDHLGTPQAQERYAAFLTDCPSLISFPTASCLLGHLRGLRHVNGSGAASDEIFRILRERLGKSGEIAETILLLSLVPALHATASSFARSCPMLDREDLSQQTVTIFVTLVHGEDWRRHETHLAFALAREIRRFVSLWVQNEVRLLPEFSDRPSPERSISAADLFERKVQLKHFLTRSLDSGALDEHDLHLLIEFKLEGGIEERPRGPVPNAVRQRMKRLLAKMRRHASRRGC